MDSRILEVDGKSFSQQLSRFGGRPGATVRRLPGVRVHLGSILSLTCDAIVSPANSFGFMDGGIDALYMSHFGPQIQDRLRDAIRVRHHGELLVGAADVIETGNAAIPCLIAAPTMRVPMILKDSVNPYLAARASERHQLFYTDRPKRLQH